MSRYYWLASPCAALLVGVGLCLWYLLDPPRIAGLASGARHVSLAFGILLVGYGTARLLTGADRDGLGNRIRWPVVVSACALFAFGAIRLGESERATRQRAIDRGIDEVSAWETREAARNTIRQYLIRRERGDGPGACATLTPSLREALRSQAGAGSCGRSVLASTKRIVPLAVPFDAFVGEDMWVDLDGEWSSARRAWLGPEHARTPVVEVVRASAADDWRINGVWPDEGPRAPGAPGAAPS